MMRLIPLITHLLDDRQEFVIARIIDSQGSSPRSSGWMVIEKNGESSGTVGGGALEGMVQKLAVDVIAEKKSRRKKFMLNSNDKDGLDMRCGGDVEIQLDYFNGSDLKQAESCRKLIHELEEDKEVYIVGAGHVGLALANQLALLDIPVIAMDDRKEYANRERFPKAKDIKVVPEFSDIFSGYEIGENSYIAIMTRGHKWDLEVLDQALKTDAGYIGMIGSRAKIITNFKILRERGAAEESLNKVNAPIGLTIPCETPEEIAVSIAGKLLCVKYGREVR